MVMHARKPQRINDGYFEKHQAHPYQNAKYNSAKGNYDARYNHERMRESPNGNSFRSDSPDSQSPRDRSYPNKSYMQKIREKERENRDYKARDKYSDCARSPKDKRSRESRDSEHRTNHDRSSAEEKREERDRGLAARMGEWTEHMSSSGKKYYYNCKSEVSQWEKPREWIERDRNRDKPRDRDLDSRNYGGSSRSHDKHSNSRASISNSRDPPSKLVTQVSSDKRDTYWNSQSSGSRDDGDPHDRRKHLDSSFDRSGNHVPGKDECSSFPCGSNMFAGESQDMDISPGDSTPTSETSYSDAIHRGPINHHSAGPVLLATALPRLASHPTHQHHQIPGRSNYTPNKNSTPSSQKSPSPGQQPSATPHSTPSMVPPPNSTVVTSNAPGPPPAGGLPRLVSQMCGLKQQLPDSSAQKPPTMSRQASNEAGNGLTSSLLNNQHLQPLKVETNHSTTVGDGPPTPTHSESQDCVDARKLSDNAPSSLNSLHHLSQQSGVSSLNALRPQEPHLTPSLANHYRDDLVNHVRGWPADVVEKQAQKLGEEGLVLSSLQCTRVSAELKTARSLVRLTEIQATLQEQRILFLRQQIAMLEEMKSHNSFMSDDS